MAVNRKNISDSIGFHIDFANRECFAPNLINYSSWNVGTGTVATQPALYGMSGFVQNGQANENVRSFGTDPFGYANAIVWKGSSNTTSTYDGSGGWNSENIPIDPTKLYRFSVWTKRDAGSDAGNFYFGPSFLNSSFSIEKNYSLRSPNNDNAGLTYSTTNPYFHYTPASAQPPFLGGMNVWTLIVGHIWPAGTPRGSLVPGSDIGSLPANYSHPDSGIWTRSSGKIGTLATTPYVTTLNADPTSNQLSLLSDFVFNTSTAFTRQRTYFYYSVDLGTTQSFIYPRVDLVDGTEPTIKDLLTGPEPIRDLSPRMNTIYPFSSTNFGIDGKSLRMSGIDREVIGGYISSPFSASCISVWFKPAVNILTSSVGNTLFQFGPPDGSGWYFYIGDSSSSIGDEIITLSGPGGRNTYVNTSAFPSFSANTWYNIILNFNGSSYDIYVNGSAVATAPMNANGHATFISSVTYVAIGGRIYPGVHWGAFLNGWLGSIVVHERSLVASEISDSYQSSKIKYGY